MNKKELLIIIPAYNEEENISDVLKQLEHEGVPAFADILVIDDASSDSTGMLVKEHQYMLVTHVFNKGYGSALQLGYKYAVRRNYKYVIQMDADGQHDACNISVIYNKLKEKGPDGNYPDIVLASRFLEGSSYFEVSSFKKIMYRVFCFIIRLAAGIEITDPTTGLQGLSRCVFSYNAKYNHFDDKYPDANMIIQSALLKFQIAEVPSVMHKRIKGKSMHRGLKPVWYMFRMFFSILTVIFRIKVLKMDVQTKL